MRELTVGFNDRCRRIFDTRRRDLLSSSTWKNPSCAVVQVTVSYCVGHMETLDLFVSASYDGITLQLQRSSAGSEKKTLLCFISNVGCFRLTQGHAPGKLAARVGVSVGIGISSSDHRRVYPLTCILSVQDILMNQHREALSRLSGSSPLVLHGVYTIFGLGMILRLGASSTNGPSS
ncbi:hypothetical protein AVEN_187934-1 [Araneus ventricosus]|uniref:Uncharacterized protein n=1 Tax=Araneus ventricosus TaxID=182803 RepID=A0A4Y2DYI5_ARAVE|nr:hypothetical protein AVEN_187934-1 [Araneus ventricosus]